MAGLLRRAFLFMARRFRGRALLERMLKEARSQRARAEEGLGRLRRGLPSAPGAGDVSLWAKALGLRRHAEKGALDAAAAEEHFSAALSGADRRRAWIVHDVLAHPVTALLRKDDDVTVAYHRYRLERRIREALGGPERGSGRGWKPEAARLEAEWRFGPDTAGRWLGALAGVVGDGGGLQEVEDGIAELEFAVDRALREVDQEIEELARGLERVREAAQDRGGGMDPYEAGHIGITVGARILPVLERRKAQRVCLGKVAALCARSRRSAGEALRCERAALDLAGRADPESCRAARARGEESLSTLREFLGSAEVLRDLRDGGAARDGFCDMAARVLGPSEESRPDPGPDELLIEDMIRASREAGRAGSGEDAPAPPAGPPDLRGAEDTDA